MQSLTTALIDTGLNVSERLKNLAKWQKEWEEQAKFFDMLIEAMADPPSYFDLQKAAEIARLRRRLELQQVRIPFEIPVKTIKEIGGFGPVRQLLVNQYAQLTNAERLLWLNNLLFLMTPELRDLNEKIARVRAWRSGGQQRNFLLGGDTGTGKSTFLCWYNSHFLPTVQRTRNHVPVVHIDAPEGKSARFLLQRIISACGINYVESENEEQLTKKILLYFQRCGVELLIVDEVEHIKAHSVRRRLLDLSNLAYHVPIICASCQPEDWIEGDSEIAGRWNDYVRLHPYTGIRLQLLLSLIDLLLPFPKSSFIDSSSGDQASPEKKSTDEKVAFLEEKTKGLLRDLMPLLTEASKEAIEKGMPSLDLDLLQRTWKKMRTQEAIKARRQSQH